MTGILQHRTERAWTEIDIGNLIHNARALRCALPEACGIMAVVKADAYGHGGVEAARALSREGVSAFAVATIDEGAALRRNGIGGEILILGFTDPLRAPELSRLRLSQTIVDSEYAAELDRAGKPVTVHIKVDTGMHRLGENCDNVSAIEAMFRLKHLSVNGIFTHLCTLDGGGTGGAEFAELQEQRFRILLGELKARGVRIPKTHVQSSYGVLRCNDGCCYARVGIALYGAASLKSGGRYIDLRPVLALKARVALVRTISSGESAGYGLMFTARRDTRIAVLTIGYADGIPRNMSRGRGCALVRGRRAPIIGNICMDQLMIDVTDIPQVKRGDTATLIGHDGAEEITAMQAAQAAGTIPNELLCRLGGRLERVYIREQAYGERLGEA